VIVYTECPARRPGGRGPGDLSAHDGDAVGAQLEGGARLLVLRASFVYVSRGRNRLYWRARASWNTSTSFRQASARNHAPAGPDATSVGWVYQYAVLARTARSRSCARSRTGSCATRSRSLGRLRSASVAASCSSTRHRRPVKLRSYGVPLMKVRRSSRFNATSAARDRDAERSTWSGAATCGAGGHRGAVVRREGTPCWSGRGPRGDVSRRAARLAELNGDGEIVQGIVVAGSGRTRST